MLPAPIPIDEDSRLASLRRMQILSTPAEEPFDRITRVASYVFQVPIALISLIDADRQWFKSSVGIAEQQTPREVSFCGHVVHSGEPMIIEDASKDDRFADNPLVCSGLNIRFYAGHPLRNHEGYIVGTLCLIDQKPRSLTRKEQQILEDLSSWAETLFIARGLSRAMTGLLNELDLAKRESMIDPLLRTWNRSAIMDILSRENDHASREETPLSILMVDVDHFKSINDVHGHPVGDVVLVEVVKALRQQLRSYDSIGRYGGEEFMVVLPSAGRNEAIKLAERLRKGVESALIEVGDTRIPCTVSIGVKSIDPHFEQHIDTLVMAADHALLAAKSKGRNRVEYAED
ncbi:MAG TPA: diguanylate cyclase [Methylophilaceae bacterium]|nr:diguanylate cyclase [Methylophilaceae bacterium]